MKSAIIPILLLCLTAGCAGNSNYVLFGTVEQSASKALSDDQQFLLTVYTKDQYTQMSMDFLKHRPTIADLKLGPDLKCSSTIDHEIAMGTARSNTFKILSQYYSKMGDLMSTKDIDDLNTKIQAAIGDVDTLAVGLGDKEADVLLSGVKAFVASAFKLADTIKQAGSSYQLASLARKNQDTLDGAISTLKSGLISDDPSAHAMAEVMNWQQCEYQRIEMIFVDPQSTKKEVSDLYDAYQAQLVSMKSTAGALPTQTAIIGYLNQLSTVNHAIAAGTMTLDDLKTQFGYAKAVVDAAKDALSKGKAVIKQT